MRSLVIDLHSWRRFAVGEDLFDIAVCLGFVSIYIDRRLTGDRLHHFIVGLRDARDTLRRRVGAR